MASSRGVTKYRRSVEGKTIAITGAARGIGFASAKVLTNAGAKVVIGDIDTDAVHVAAADLGVLGLHLDVTQNDSFTAFLDRTEDKHGPLDVLINNAGIMPTGPLLEYGEELIRRTIDIDLMGVILGTQLAAERMVAHGRGQIINVASIAGRMPAPGLSIYNAAKFGVVGFTEAVNAELEPHNVRVSTVQPSHTATELIDGLNSGGLLVASPEQVADTIVKVVHTRRLHAYPTFGLGAVTLMGLVPGTIKRRLLRTPTYRDMFLVSDSEKRRNYTERIARS